MHAKIMLEHLKFSDDSDFLDAFVIPGMDSDMHQVGKKQEDLSVLPVAERVRRRVV